MHPGLTSHLLRRPWLSLPAQHEGKGGDNDLADGLNVADVLRERHPDLFQVLVDTPVYFQESLPPNHFIDSIDSRESPLSCDILVLDNTRVLHGRQAFEPDVSSGPRHIHNAYIDWDELRSKRRVLQRRFKVDLA
nr:uncharacterized protein LOC113823678 [Penaeus vannamei]